MLSPHKAPVSVDFAEQEQSPSPSTRAPSLSPLPLQATAGESPCSKSYCRDSPSSYNSNSPLHNHPYIHQQQKQQKQYGVMPNRSPAGPLPVTAGGTGALSGPAAVVPGNPAAPLAAAAGKDSDVVEFLRSFCFKYRRSQAELEAAVSCLVTDNWFDTVEQLRSLTDSQWGALDLPAELLLALRSCVEGEQQLEGEECASLERVVAEAAVAMGRSEQQVQAVVAKLRENNYHTAGRIEI